jgi:hypothetical protein
MINYIVNLVKDFFLSFSNKDGGFSARKLSACTAVFVAISETTRIDDATILMYVIFSWLTFACVCLGLVTIPELIKVLKGKDESSISKQADSNSTGE